MNKILVVLPFSANDGVLAERLCDLIYLINKREKVGHVLLVAAHDTHPEMREKVKIAAEVAFEGVSMIVAPAINGPDKNLRVNLIFKTAAEHITKTYRIPWLWLEPDAVPINADWLKEITKAHYDQPKRYSGSFMVAGDKMFMARVAVYPPDAFTDLSGFLAMNGAFNQAAGGVSIPKATKTRLVQETSIVDETTPYNQSAMVIHGDKHAIIMQKMREIFEKEATVPQPRPPGRPRKVQQPEALCQ